MRALIRGRPAAILVAYLLVLGGTSAATWAGEEFHPKGYDARRAEADQSRAREERRDKEPVTRSEEVWRGKDLTNEPKGELPDFSKLQAKIEAQREQNLKTPESSRVEQAEHAWDRRGDSEFTKLGIRDAKQLQAHAESVRTRPDIKKELDGGRIAYGQFHEGGGKNGTIVIDNPRADNGGTIMTNRNIEQRMKDLK